MAKIHRISDRIKVNVGGLVFTISPLTFDQKSEIQALAVSGNFQDSLRSAKLAVKYALKDVSGLEDADGNEYKLELDESGLKEDCLDNIFNVPQSEDLTKVCLSLIKGVSEEFKDPFTGKKLKDVSVVKESSAKKS